MGHYAGTLSAGNILQVKLILNPHAAVTNLFFFAIYTNFANFHSTRFLLFSGFTKIYFILHNVKRDSVRIESLTWTGFNELINIFLRYNPFNQPNMISN